MEAPRIDDAPTKAITQIVSYGFLQKEQLGKDTDERRYKHATRP
jgi:hypothetical protein